LNEAARIGVTPQSSTTTTTTTNNNNNENNNNSRDDDDDDNNDDNNNENHTFYKTSIFPLLIYCRSIRREENAPKHTLRDTKI